MDIAKLALITSIIGVISLTMLSLKLEPESVDISDISEKDFDKFVKVEGEIVKLKLGEVTYFDIKDGTGIIRVVIFDKISLTNSQRVEVVGKVTEYHGLLEIEASKINLLN